MGKIHVFAPGEYYHIYNRGTDKRPIFLDKSDRLRFLALLYLCNDTSSVHLGNLSRVYRGETSVKFESYFDIQRSSKLVSIGAYCLMPNHFHIAIRAESELGVSKFMQKISTAYTMYFNRKYNRTGSLFQGVFKAEHLDSDVYLKYIFSYIHLNPLKLKDKNWKVNKINTSEARDYLKRYCYSSFPDFFEDQRKSSKILDIGNFPDYFRKKIDFYSHIDDFLCMNEAKPR
ncbi:MAG: transposase [Candidatus Taylorbacteria bacterium]|nr:transposase [Candidatus Taylorbacteria bacterium]